MRNEQMREPFCKIKNGVYEKGHQPNAAIYYNIETINQPNGL